MSEPLASYLHDHLAGSTFAIELLGSLRDQHGDTDLGRFAAAVLADVKEDQQVLQTIVDRVGKSDVDLKQATAWLISLQALEAFAALCRQHVRFAC
jgi:hypothetical protein